jgi:hypothetical protein
MRVAPLLLLLGSVPLWALEIQLPFHQVVADAESIYLGRVTAASARWEAAGGTKAIFTEVEFAVERVYKGPAQTRTTLRFHGGSIGGVTMDVEGSHRFRPGQRVVLFVGADAASPDPLVGGPQGLYPVTVDPRTKAETVRPSFDERATPVPLGDFEARITKLVRAVGLRRGADDRI